MENKKFSNVKIGDKVYSLIDGWGTVIEIQEKNFKVLFDRKDLDLGLTLTFDFTGRYFSRDLNPILYWNEVKLPTIEEDEKPFHLDVFVKENIMPVAGNSNLNKIIYIFNNDTKKWSYGTFFGPSYLTGLAFENKGNEDEVIETFDREKVTYDDFMETLKKLEMI